MTADTPKRILLLSAYDADSHQSWRKGLELAFEDYEWTVLTLPPRYFSWRVRGNSLTWAYESRDLLERPYDLLIATSMVDLSALRGFVPALAAIPTIVYFHENQFAYPSSDQAHSSVETQILNLYTALCGDRVLFNTAFNRDSFLEGAKNLLRRLPDLVPAGIVERLQQRSCVIPVPIADVCYQGVNLTKDPWAQEGEEGPGKRSLRILWAARWEYDKGPELLLAILRQLQHECVDFKLCLMGQKFRRVPEEFKVIEAEYADLLVQFGYETDSARYRQWLAGADLVLSTALHEFQGLSVLEAMAAGAIPVMPDRLSYPELVDAPFLYAVKDKSLAEQAREAVALIQRLRSEPMPHRAPNFSWSALEPHYREVFESLF